MRNSRSTDSRLRQLEGELGEASMVLRFADGSSRGVRVAKEHRLPLLLHAFDLALPYAPLGPDGERFVPSRPEPNNESIELLNLMGEAESIEGDRLFQTIFGICKDVAEKRKEKEKQP